MKNKGYVKFYGANKVHYGKCGSGLTDDIHNKHLQCSDIRGYSIENGSVRGSIAQNVNVEMLFLKWECTLRLLLVLSNCSEPVGYLQA